MADLVIRDALLVDGSGGEPRRGDVACEGGVITEVGEVVSVGRREISR